MKRVLMISSFFPPKGGGGVLRQFKFAKYLPDFDWNPLVLTCNKRYFFEDKELLKELPAECRIFKFINLDFRNLFKYRLSQSGPSSKKASRKSFLNGVFKKPLIFLKDLAKHFLIPDAYIVFTPFAVLKGLRIIRDYDISLIYSIDNPCSNHITALILKAITKKPWVADFKDPWMKGWENKGSKFFLLSWPDKKLQKLVLQNCDVCVSSDYRIEGMLKKEVREDIPKKFFVINNGFDRRDFMGDSSTRKSGEPFKITYVGTVYRDMPPLNFLKSIQELVDSQAIPKEQIKLIFVGSHECGETLQDPVYSALLKEGIVSEVGLVTHKESIDWMVKSDALLLINAFVNNSEQMIPSKLYEYLASRRPVIALVEEGGSCAEIIRNSKSGYIVAPDDLDQIKKTILMLYESLKGGNYLILNPEERYLEQFERKNNCSRLAEIFSGLNNDSRKGMR